MNSLQEQRAVPTPDLSIHMPTYSNGKQLSELTERRAGQTRPLFDLMTEATNKKPVPALNETANK